VNRSHFDKSAFFVTRSLFFASFTAFDANILSRRQLCALPASIFVAPGNSATVKHDRRASVKDSD
jgi:hypothetical protein